MQQFDKGLKLYSLARNKARDLGMPSKAVKIEVLINGIQEKEGNTPCFRVRRKCTEILCCWQASCGAEMTVE